MTWAWTVESLPPKSAGREDHEEDSFPGRSTQFYAWNNLGHMVVAFIAYQHLTDSARMRANALIKQNPFLKAWLKQIPDGTQR